jgi:hypothetical protein
MTQRLNPLSKPRTGFWLLPIFIVATLVSAWRFLPWTTPLLFGSDDLLLYLAFIDGDCATRASEIFTATCQERFRPIASGSILALMHVFGEQKSLFFDVNFAIQGAIATLSFLIAFHLSRRSWLAALAIAGAVALSRFAVWNVVQVIGPVESLPLLLTLGTVYSVVRADECQQHTWRWGLLALLCTLIAIFAHERFTVVPVWLGLAFLSSNQVRQLPVWRIAVLIGGCVALPLFYIAYKTFALHSDFLIGTANTHLKLDFPLILQHAYEGVSSIFGFNRGASYLLGENVTPGWNAPFVLAAAFLLLFLATTLYALRCVLAPASSLRAKMEVVRWPALLLILAAFLLTPALLTIRLEIRWLYASFILVLLVCAWAVSAVSRNTRRRVAVAVVLLCITSVALDTTIMRSFGGLFFVYSGRFAELVKRDIVDKHPEQKGGIALLTEFGECNFTLLSGAFFRVYGNGTRAVHCYSSVDAFTNAKLPADVHLYVERNKQLVDVTAALSQVGTQTSDELPSYNFIKAFEYGHISDTAHVDTPTGKGALVMPWNTAIGPRTTLTVISGFSYRYEGVTVPQGAQLRFSVGQVYPSPQSARAIVRLSSGNGEPVAIFSRDLVPPKAGGDIHFTFVSVPLMAYAGQQLSVSFSVESPGGNSSGHWVAFIDPRIVEIKK